jgi:hypothetical protein
MSGRFWLVGAVAFQSDEGCEDGKAAVAAARVRARAHNARTRAPREGEAAATAQSPHTQNNNTNSAFLPLCTPLIVLIQSSRARLLETQNRIGDSWKKEREREEEEEEDE